MAASTASLSERFPRPLLARAERVWRADVQPAAARPGKLQEDVSAALWSLGCAHVSGAATPDALFCVDILLDGQKVPGPCFLACLVPL